MELLAIIIILGAVAMMVTPIVTSIINGTTQKAVLSSAQSYVRAVNDQIVSNQTKYLTAKTMNGATDDSILIKDTDIDTNGLVKPYSINDLTARGVTVDGYVPTNGGVIVANGTVFDCALVINGYLVEYDESTGNFKATKGGTYSESSITLPAVLTLKKADATRYVQDSTSSIDGNYALGDVNYRYLTAANTRYFLINGIKFRTIGIMSTLSGDGSKESRIKLISEQAISNTYASFDAVNTYLNNDYKKTLTDITSYDIKTQYYSGTSSYTQTQAWDIPTRTYKDYNVLFKDVYKAERYNKTLLQDSFYYSAEVDPYSADVGLMYESDCFAASWLRGYGLTVTKKYNTNNYYNCGSSGINDVSFTSAITIHPVIYLPKNAVISGGSGTSASPYTLKYIK